MKYLVIPALLAGALALTACGKKDEQAAEAPAQETAAPADATTAAEPAAPAAETTPAMEVTPAPATDSATPAAEGEKKE